MKQIKLLFIIALLCAAMPNLRGQNLATWTFTNAANDWGTSPTAPVSSGSNITVVGLTRGSGVGITGSAAGTAWGGTNFYDNLSAGLQTAATAVDSGNYITFSFTANAGFSLSFSGIPTYNIRRSSTGPNQMIWQYSLDGSSYTNIGSTISIGGGTGTSGNEQLAINLSGIPSLQNVPSGTTVTFRAVMWGATGNGGTWYFNSHSAATSKSFLINGTVNSTPLSLDLISFKGQSENNMNQLDWVTANEKDVAYFELERGTNGTNFNRIATLNAKGNNKPADNYYAYKDEQAAMTAYYRLRTVDIDGKSSYSNVVVLRKGNDTKHGIYIYPNPAASTLFLEGMSDAASYSIIDVAGRCVVPVHQVNAENALISIDVSNLMHGVYFLQVNKYGNKETVRFIKK